MLKWRCRFVIAFVSVASIGGTLHSDEPASGTVNRPEVTVSRATTFVLGPMRDDGSIDYAAAINGHSGQGIEPKHNALVTLIQAIGPNPQGADVSAAFFQSLGMNPPPADGDYFQPLWEAIDVEALPIAERQKLFDQQDKAISQPWKREKFPQLVRWIDANSIPLLVLHRASVCESYYRPLIVDDSEYDDDVPVIASLAPYLQVYRSIARLMCARSMMNLGGGDCDAAWEDLVACHRLARLVGREPTLVDGLVGISIEQMVMEAELVFMREAKLTSTQWSHLRETLRSLPDRDSFAEKVNWGERCVFLDSLMTIAWNRDSFELLGVEDGLAEMGKVIQSLELQSIPWDDALRRGNDWYDQTVQAMQLPTFVQRRDAFDTILSRLQDVKDQMKDAQTFQLGIEEKPVREKFISRFVGDVTAALLIPAIGSAASADERVNQRFVNLDTALALKAFQADKQTYPKSLAELVPDYLSRLPVDRFSDRPLMYRRTADGCLVYSVGENQNDDRGRTVDDEGKGDDLTVRLNAR